MEVKSELDEYLSSDDVSSVIFISDMSSNITSDNESIHDVHMEDDKALVRSNIQEFTETISTTEIISTTIEEPILKLDKATQTCENEFPEKTIIGIDISALSVVSNSNNCSNTLTDKTTANNPVNNNANSIDSKQYSDKNAPASTSKLTLTIDNKKITTDNSVSNNSNSNTYNENKHHEKNSSAFTPKSTLNYNKSQSSVKRTWTRQRTYQNHRVQPYQRYNSVWNNPPSNYYSANQNNNRYGSPLQGNYNYHNKYGRQPYNNYNNNNRVYYNNHNNNRYGTQPSYNNFRCQIQNYTDQFKDRLFTGFIGFMDYLFQYDYSRDVRY